MMDAGDRDECVRIFQNTDEGGVDSDGDTIGAVDVTVIAIYHVKLVAKTVKEKLSSQGETPQERYMMLGLYDRSITNEMFVEWEGEKYSIEHVAHHRTMDETHCLITTAKGRFQ